MRRKNTDNEKRPNSTEGRQDRGREAGSGERADNHRALQRGLGNREIQRLHEAGAIRTKTVREDSSDPFEREAERVALAVSRDADPTSTVDVQRDATGPASTTPGGPETRIESLRGDGRPMSRSTRSFFEQRFGHELDDVRVHTGPAADELTRSIDAEAFTYGRDVVFAEGNYRPETTRGKSLLAHELTHVVQQREAGSRIQRQSTEPESGETVVHEVEAGETLSEIAAQYDHVDHYEQLWTYSDNARRLEGKHRIYPGDRVKVPPKSDTTADEGTDEKEPTPEESDDATDPRLPGYTQYKSTCGAASLVTALLTWDRQRHGTGEPAHMTARAVTNLLDAMEGNKATLIEDWGEKHPSKSGEEVYDQTARQLHQIRNRALEPDVTITEPEYQAIGNAMYFLYADDQRGLSGGEIDRIHDDIGLERTGGRGARSFDDVFSGGTLARLQAGRVAQVGWFVDQNWQNDSDPLLSHHVFLVGRFADGEWFLSDQGQPGSFELVTDSLGELRRTLIEASREGESWISVAPPAQLSATTFTGVKVLDDPETIRDQELDDLYPYNLFSEGTELAEVDAGSFTLGEAVTVERFGGHYNTLAEAQSRNHAFDGGAFIFEYPDGVYNVYETNRVGDENVGVDDIDRSGGGVLTGEHVEKFGDVVLLLTSGDRSNRIEIE